ncbi:MAG: amidohydrolase [Acidobacteria bacterium]|nr:amidohydrolase [Acidobacteriota bacterium]
MKRFASFLLLLLATPLFGQTLDQRIDRDLASFVETYQSLHAAPELSTQEAKTSAFVAQRLCDLGWTVTYPFGKYEDPKLTCYGVVAVMKNGAGPTVLVRSDMDALPVIEQTGLPYASTVKTKNATGEEVGVMHACGHDLHMTTLLGTAKMLADLRKQWHGTVILVGQPAEEVVLGANGILHAGLYEQFGKPNYAIAMHDWSSLEAGKIGWCPGFFMSNSDSVNLTIRGVGGHGASPQSTKDPVIVAAQTVLALQTIVSRETSPLDPVVVTVGSIHGGAKRNVIPDEVKLLLTVRTYKPEVRKRVLASIERVARGVATAAGMPDDRMPIFEYVQSEAADATYNDPALTERLAKALEGALGAANVVRIDPAMVSEDFGRFGVNGQVPTALLALGAVDPAKIASGERLPSLHSSRFAPLPEPSIRTGVKAMTSMVLDLLK